MRIPLHLGILLLWASLVGAGQLSAAEKDGVLPGEPNVIGMAWPSLVVEAWSRDDFEDGRAPAASSGDIPPRRVVDPVLLSAPRLPAATVALYKLHRSFLI